MRAGILSCKSLEDIRCSKRTVRLEGCAKESARIGLPGQLITFCVKKLVREAADLRLERELHIWLIRSKQPVIDENLDILTVENKLSVHMGFFFEPLACSGSRTRRLLQALLIVAVKDGFAIVADTEAAIGIVHAVVGFVADNHDAGPVGHMAIVGYVNQKLGKNLALNPAVKDGNQRIKINSLLWLQQKLNVNMLKLYQLEFPY